MGDSDDDYERRRRDKFKRERNDYNERDRRRDNWDDSHRKDRTRFPGNRESSWGRRGRDQYSSRDSDRRRDRYSPSPPPPSKRMRRDWDDRGGYEGGGSGGGGGFGPMGPPGWGPDLREYLGPQPAPFMQARVHEVDYPTQPPMLTFKQFLGQQDDTISEEDAVKKYNTYKQDFQKQQVIDYFLAHKDEE